MVASFADAVTSVGVLAKPALPEDITAAKRALAGDVTATEGPAYSAGVFYTFYGSALGTCFLTSLCSWSAVSRKVPHILFAWCHSGYKSCISLWAPLDDFPTVFYVTEVDST